MACSVLIDFSLPNKGKLLEFTVSDESLPPMIEPEVVHHETNVPLIPENNETQIIIPLERNPNVEQFALNAEK